MIFAPPQHGKSELVSRRFPAYWLGMRPDDPIVTASYGGQLAWRNSRDARDLVESAEYAELFPRITTNRTSRAVEYWALAGRRGALVAAGVGGPITGYGGMLGLIDDPYENWEQAQSETIRQSVLDWYKSTFRTRIWENGAIVIIMTRWHEYDLAGVLLKDQGAKVSGGRWLVLRLPALAETQEERDEANRQLGLPAGMKDPLNRKPGEALCPSRFSKSTLEQIKHDSGSLVWGGLYQGVPRTPEGNRIKRAWLAARTKSAPLKGYRVRYWDKAATEGDGAAKTAGVLMTYDSSKDYVFVEDVVRGAWTRYQRDQIMIETAAKDAERYPGVEVWHEQEPGSGGKESAEITNTKLSRYSVHKQRATGDKDVRLEPFAAKCEAGRVVLVEGPWNEAYVDELTLIPNGLYRDQGDASAGAYNKLMEMAESHQVWVY